MADFFSLLSAKIEYNFSNANAVASFFPLASVSKLTVVPSFSVNVILEFGTGC